MFFAETAPSVSTKPVVICSFWKSFTDLAPREAVLAAREVAGDAMVIVAQAVSEIQVNRLGVPSVSGVRPPSGRLAGGRLGLQLLGRAEDGALEALVQK